MWFPNQLWRKVAATLTVVALSGCAGVPYPRQELAPLAASKIKHLVILRIDEAERLDVPIDITTGQSVVAGLFGPIGVAVIAGTGVQRTATRTPLFTSAMASEQASFADFLANELSNALSVHDVRTEYLHEQRPKAQGSEAFDYSGIPKNADAWMHVRFRSIGYIDNLSASDCVPRVLVTALIVDPRSGATLFQRSVLAGHGQVKARELDVVPGDLEPRFTNFDALMASPGAAAEALRTRIRAVAKRLVLALNLPKLNISKPSDGLDPIPMAISVKPLPVFPSSWKVTVEGDPRTRTLIIRGAEQTVNSILVLDATYGWSDRAKLSIIDAQFVMTNNGYRLTLVTPANSRIIADAVDADTFVGEFKMSSGTKRVRLERIRE